MIGYAQPSPFSQVWWVFKAMHKKGLVYKGYKVRESKGDGMIILFHIA